MDDSMDFWGSNVVSSDQERNEGSQRPGKMLKILSF